MLTSCGGLNSGQSGSENGNNGFTDGPESGGQEEDPPPQPKQIQWSDGNYYSYDLTETIMKKDSLGNETEITVYKSNPPDERSIVCSPKSCKWCGKEVNATNYTIEEYPNINWVRGQPDFSSIFGMFTMMFEGKKYYDLDNNRIRTEWRTKCNYPGPDDFCSLKCENDYKYR